MTRSKFGEKTTATKMAALDKVSTHLKYTGQILNAKLETAADILTKELKES
jgi:hypothetical protein